MNFKFLVGAVLGIASVIIVCFLKENFDNPKLVYKNR
jgi:hypothetical protein